MRIFKRKNKPSYATQTSEMSLSAEPDLSFAEQMMAGSEGRHARRSVQFSASIKASLENSAITIEGEPDLEEEEEEEEKPKTKSNDEPESEKKNDITFGPRRISPSVASLYGIDESSEAVFMKTMGMDSGHEVGKIVKSRRNFMEGVEEEEDNEKAAQDAVSDDPYNIPFESAFDPDDMRCLALVAHNHMKPAMKDFVMSHQEVLKKFRLTGTNTTMTMLRDTFGDDPTVKYGPAFNSGPLGGDAELCALMCLEDLGGVFFFMDPLSAHPHQADIESLVRLTNVHNIITCCNPCSAHAMCFVLKCALEGGRKDKIPSFFTTLKSPGVAVYKAEQQKALEAAKNA
mmetsp:Transcript_3027/g.4559  ORF Transcript_3027/g.4559 Transcript_3027/m.4559 type:complete len:344 (+) Transcript_3027:92-1123(+)